MSKHDPIPLPPNYFERSQRPLQALIFLLPMIVLYELALPSVAATGGDPNIVSDILARRMLYQVFEKVGVTGYYLPGIIVVVVLLCWHLAKRDPWRFEWRTYAVMFGESVTLAIPLFVFQMVLFRHGALQADAAAALQQVVGEPTASGASTSTWRTDMVLSLGAGIYEEMLFRLIAITMFHMVLADLLKVPNKYAVPIVIALSSILFAFYHFSEEDPFQWGHFVFFTGAGIYFAFIFVSRGFGIVAGAHAMYDVLVELLKLMQGSG